MTVRSESKNALREAIVRLLAGEASRCDGQLTWSNVCLEAGVPRSTAARASDVLAEWKSQCGISGKPASPFVLNLDQVHLLKRELSEKARQYAQTERALNESIRVLANQIQALTLALAQRDIIIAKLERDVSQN